MTLVVAIHYTRETGWKPAADISQEVLEQRVAAVPETDFIEPMNRTIGSDAAGVFPAGEGGVELEEGEESEAEEGETIQIANNENILDVGEEEGWDLPYACKQCQCVSCAGQIQDGPAQDYIRHNQNECLFEDDMDDGYRLICIAYPTDDFTIETGEQP